MRAASAGAIGLLLAAVATPAAAQDAGTCERTMERGPQRFTPAVGAGRVTLDAPIKVEFSEGYFEDPVVGADPAASIELLRTDTEEPVSGSVQVYRGNTLLFVPDAPLAPDTPYEGTAFGFDVDKDFRFHTGHARDTRPPHLDEISGVGASRIQPRCDAPDGGYRVDVNIAPADDDGPSGSIEYLLYLSRGPGVDGPELRARQRGFSTDVITMAFVLEPNEASGPVCVVAHAVDGVGNVDDDGKPVCFDPADGNYFEPLCSASSAVGGREASGPLALMGAAGGAVLLRRRRRRAFGPGAS